MAAMTRPLCSRPAFAGSRVAAVAPMRLQQQQRAQAVVVRAAHYPDPKFIKECEKAFPDKAVATPDEARVLLHLGYIYLDVRPTLEVEEVGKYKGAVNIPVKHSKKVFDRAANKKSYVKSDNPDFVDQVKRKFPKLDTKLIVGCSDFHSYSVDALEALDEAGYTSLVALKGGYYNWFRFYDNNLRRRITGEYAEQYSHDGDSCGIHSSGAGFDRVDKIEAWQPPKF